MQVFMSFYFWTLHLIWWLIYSKQRLNLQDCNKPGAQPRYGRSQRHAIRSPSITRAIAAHTVTPGQCHRPQPWALTLGHSRNPALPSPWATIKKREPCPTLPQQKALNRLPVPSSSSPQQHWEMLGLFTPGLEGLRAA